MGEPREWSDVAEAVTTPGKRITAEMQRRIDAKREPEVVIEVEGEVVRPAAFDLSDVKR